MTHLLESTNTFQIEARRVIAGAETFGVRCSVFGSGG